MTVAYACSLGGTCVATELLNRNNLKLFSCPFDWVFSRPDIVLDCLDNNFKTFLDKKHYVAVTHENNNRACKHLLYYPDERHMFNHHDPLENEEHYEYFNRCISRFNALLAKPELKLFIMFFRNGEYAYDKNEMIEFNSQFSKYAANYRLLIVFHKIGDPSHTHTTVGNIDFLDLTLSRELGVGFENESDNTYLNNVLLSMYTFNVIPL